MIKRALLVLFLAVVVLNWTWARLPGQPPAPSGSKYATVDDVRVHYVERPGREPAVVMIHGMPGTWGDWDAVAQRLRGRHTIQVDRPGFAFSEQGYLPFERQVESVHALTRQLKLKRPVIAGHSYGGSIALSYAMRYPLETSGVVLIDPGVPGRGIPLKRKLQARSVRVLQVPVVKQVADLTFSNVMRRVSMGMGGSEAFDPDTRDQGWFDRALSLTARHRDLDAWSSEVLNYDAAMERLSPRLAHPVTDLRIIQGDGDRLVPTEDVQRVAARIDVPLQLLAGGHMQTDVHPDAVVRAIDAVSKR